MRLSERLEIHAKDVLQAANPNDDMVLGYYQLSDLAEALTEAVALAKRYEDAPVVRDVTGKHGFLGQRVRIIREPINGSISHDP